MPGLGNGVGRLSTNGNSDSNTNTNFDRNSSIVGGKGGMDHDMNSSSHADVLDENRHGSPLTMIDSEQKSLLETYKSCIQQYLAVHLLDNATFYAERLVATSTTSDSLYLLGLCYYRQNQPQRTKFVLQQHECKCDDSPDLLYLLATACNDLEDYSTAEEALLRQVRRDFRKADCNDINQYILTTSVSTSCTVHNA